MDERRKKIKLIQGLFEANRFSCSVETASKLLEFSEMLFVWNKRVNLTARRSLEEIILKDFIDAAYFNMYRIMYTNDSREILELGAGAGFIGVTVSVLHPEVNVCLLDSSRKRTSFVKKVIAELKMTNSTVEWGRGEEIKPHFRERFDTVVTRASFNLSQFLDVASMYVHNYGHLFFMAGPLKKYSIRAGVEKIRGLSEQQYVIKPSGYRRKIMIFGKESDEASST